MYMQYIETDWYSWAPSPLSAHSEIGLTLTPISDHSDIELKGSQSDIISGTGLIFLAISNIRPE
jgi:hypothetical protein